METQEIKTLLDKYYAGNSSLCEELQLYSYFLGTEVAEELKPYQALFIYMAEEQLAADTSTADDAATPVGLKVVRRKCSRLVYWGVGIAASLALSIGILRNAGQPEQHPKQLCQENFVMVNGKCTDDPNEIGRHASQAIEAILSSDAKAMDALEHQLYFLQ